MFPKKTNNFRRVHPSDDRNGEDPTVTSSKPFKRLSFEGEDESPSTSTRQRVRYWSSHRLVSKQERLSSSRPVTASPLLSNFGEYTQDKLRELEKNTPTVKRPKVTAGPTPRSYTTPPDIDESGSQELKIWISALCEYLQHKVPLIEELEKQVQKLHEDFASGTLERRAADKADEMLETEAGENAAMSVFHKDDTGVAAATAAQAASAANKSELNLPVQLNEFGTDVNLPKHLDMMRRAEARKCRKDKANSSRDPSVIEGELSTDDSESENTSYHFSRNLLLQFAEQIFNDDSPYSKISSAKERFDSLKKISYDYYLDTNMPSRVPAILSKYVRVELLKWDPLHEMTSFNQMQWHTALFDYDAPDDDFATLLPALVEITALPILHHRISNCWDVFSTRETINAASATRSVIDYVTFSSDAVRQLVAVIRTRLADSIASLNVPAWTPLTTPNAEWVAIYQFGMSVRLLRNICWWSDVLHFHILEKLALDDLLVGKILPQLRSVTANIHVAITRTERIILSLDTVWAGRNARWKRSKQLQELVDFVSTLVETLERKRVSGMNVSEASALASRLKKILVELHEYDRAALVQNF